jgi:3-oxoacyl-[acyl-carrier protein] reductase
MSRDKFKESVMSKSVAIVTGASQGIGRPRPFASRAIFQALVLVARNREPISLETAEAVKAAGAKAAGDRSRSGRARRRGVVDQTLAAFGRIDALLNIAGAVPQIDLFEMTDAQWEAAGAQAARRRRLTIAAWPALKEAKGAVVLMSGNSALFPESALCGRRHDQRRDRRAGEGLFRSRHHRRRAGQQRAARPGDDRPPPFVSQHWAPLHNMTVEEATANFPKEAGIARYGEPEEIAELMAFLVSPGARWMTGSTLRMDGGEVKSPKSAMHAHAPVACGSFTTMAIPAATKAMDASSIKAAFFLFAPSTTTSSSMHIPL